LCKELQQYKKSGIELLLNGQPSTPEEIAKACIIKEESKFMRDYIRGESDQILGIGFDFVKDI